MRSASIILVAVLFFSAMAAAATVRGDTYNGDTLDMVDKAIITVNTAPEQVRVAENGSYSFEIPDGNYTLVAKKYDGGKLALEAAENLTIENNGTYVVDLLLLPPNEYLSPGSGQEIDILAEETANHTDGLDLPADEPALPAAEQNIAQAALAALMLAGIAYFLWKKLAGGKPAEKIPSGAARKADASPPKKMDAPARRKSAAEKETPISVLSPEQKELVGVLKKSGGFAPQKEIRKALPYSEAKVSLTITELEEIGMVKKFKRGRGNLIKLAGNFGSQRKHN